MLVAPGMTKYSYIHIILNLQVIESFRDFTTTDDWLHTFGPNLMLACCLVPLLISTTLSLPMYLKDIRQLESHHVAHEDSGLGLCVHPDAAAERCHGRHLPGAHVPARHRLGAHHCPQHWHHLHYWSVVLHDITVRDLLSVAYLLEGNKCLILICQQVLINFLTPAWIVVPVARMFPVTACFWISNGYQLWISISSWCFEVVSCASIRGFLNTPPPCCCRASLPLCGNAERDDQVRNEHCSFELLPRIAWGSGFSYNLGSAFAFSSMWQHKMS